MKGLTSMFMHITARTFAPIQSVRKHDATSGGYDETVAHDRARSEKTDAYIIPQMEKRLIPGMSLAVLRRGEIVKASAYGLANLEFNLPASFDTAYELGSMTKPFTAIALMML